MRTQHRGQVAGLAATFTMKLARTARAEDDHPRLVPAGCWFPGPHGTDGQQALVQRIGGRGEQPAAAGRLTSSRHRAGSRAAAHRHDFRPTMAATTSSTHHLPATGPGSPLNHAYRQATAVAWLGIVACQIGIAFAVRTDHASLRSVGVFSNRFLLVAGCLGQHRLLAAAVPDVPAARIGPAVLPMAKMLGHLLVQSGLEHRLGQLLQQPVRAGQGQALLPGPGGPALSPPAPPPSAQA